MVTFVSSVNVLMVIIGKVSDVFHRKLAVKKCIIEENHYAQHEIAKKREKFATICAKNKKISELQMWKWNF